MWLAFAAPRIFRAVITFDAAARIVFFSFNSVLRSPG